MAKRTKYATPKLAKLMRRVRSKYRNYLVHEQPGELIIKADGVPIKKNPCVCLCIVNTDKRTSVLGIAVSTLGPEYQGIPSVIKPFQEGVKNTHIAPLHTKEKVDYASFPFAPEFLIHTDTTTVASSEIVSFFSKYRWHAIVLDRSSWN